LNLAKEQFMKKKRFIEADRRSAGMLALTLTFAVISMALAGCDNGSTDDGSSDEDENNNTSTGNKLVITGFDSYMPSGSWIDVSAMSGSGLLEKSINWLKINAVTGTTYTIQLDTNETLSPTGLSQSVLNNVNSLAISLKGLGTERTVQLGSSGILFTVGQGVTLVLDGYLTLKGRTNA
jgi:hypothetical protein